MWLGKINTIKGKEFIAWTRKNGESLLAAKPVKTDVKGLNLASKSLQGDTVCISSKINKKAGMILNKKTGNMESVRFENSYSSNAANDNALEAINKEGQSIGKVAFCPAEEKGFLFPQDKPSMFLDFIGTSDDYKGIGTELLRKVIKASKEAGFEGRVRLTPCTGSIPTDFQFPGFFNKCQTSSAAIQYKKMGFKAYDKEVDKLLELELASGGNGLKLRQSAFGERLADKWTSPMYLPEDVIQKYLTMPA